MRHSLRRTWIPQRRPSRAVREGLRQLVAAFLVGVIPTATLPLDLQSIHAVKQVSSPQHFLHPLASNQPFDFPRAEDTAGRTAKQSSNPLGLRALLSANRTRTAVPSLLLAAIPPQAPNLAVHPVLECVTNNGGGSYTAFFGYKNDNSVSVTIPVGSNNKFTPTPIDRGQTTTFLPGRQVKTFSVPFNGSNLVWFLKGPDNSGRTSTASSNSAACTDPLPIANAGPNQTVFVDTTVQLDGTHSSDPEGHAITYSWSFVSIPSGSSATLSNAASATPTFLVDKPGSYTARLIVYDGTEASSPSQVVISTKNSPPVANPGPNQTVTTRATVQLDGSGSSDVDGDPLTYRWAFTSVPQGSTATLSNATAVNPRFVTDEKGTYIVQLIVNDGTVDSAPATVTVSDVNSPPVANPGPNQMINVGATVQLDGSHSTDVDGDSLTYAWAILSTPNGSGAMLSSTSAVQPTFVADRVGTYVAQLIVNDGTVNSQPATVTISTNDVAPVANPGLAQSVTVGTVVNLNGGGSTDSDGLPLTYQWSLLSVPSGSAAALTSTTAATTSFTADLPGNYVVQLIVNDWFLNSAPATVTVSTSDVAPVANPGANQTVLAGATVQLDGTSSTDSDHQPLTYRWAILSQPAGGSASLSDAMAAKPTFVASLAGLYVVQLIVNDGFLDSTPNTMTVTTNPVNQPPTVSAGPNQTIELPVNTVTLNGSASSTVPAGSPVTVLWTKVSGPGTVIFASATQAVTQATFPSVGTYVLQLSATVTATGLSNSAQTTVTVAPVNQPPVVTVGADQTVTYPANTANLTGTATDDGFPVGSSLLISWSKVLGPGAVTFSNPLQPATAAAFSLPGNYLVRLSASDGQYTSSADARVIYSAPAGGGIAVSAGSDQVIVFPATATLAGSASDSDPLLGNALATAWSKVSGPGTVTFANSTSPATTATFSTPGVYDLRLTAADGVFTASSDVKIYTGQIQCTLSNKSTDFWLMFIGADVGATSTTPPRQLSLFISSDVATSGTVSVPGQGFTSPFTATPGQITTVLLPQSVQVTTSDSIEPKGIHVTSQNPIAVYGLNFVPAATDGYLGLPTNTLGTSYVVASYQNTEVGASAFGWGTEFGVTATQDNTNVTIVPTANTGPKDPGHPYGTRLAQQPFTIQLNQGQTYQLKNNSDYTQGPSTSKLPVDYTGTVVTSDKPIAVFGGHDCTYIPDQFLACNHLVEQLPPTNLWGENFVTLPLSHQANGDTFRIIAQSASTHVLVNHSEVAVLQAGQFYEQIIQGPAEISANQPILVVEYAESDAFSETQFSDPSMIVVPPFEQFGGSYTINTPTTNFQDNFVNVIAPTSAVQSSTVLLDGTAVLPASFQRIGTSPFSGAQLSVSVGVHTLSAGLPFGVMAYGFSVDDNYGYTGGVCLAQGVPGSTLAAQPRASTNQITSQVCIQATVKDSFGQPVGGAGVTFNLTGINPRSGFATTDSTGVATFCYTSTRTGSDLVTITSAGGSDTASVTWISNINQAPVVNAGPNLTVNLPNSGLLNGSVVDDGLPSGSTLTSSWSQVSGPATVSFGTANQPTTSATFSQAGAYVLKLTGSDSQLSSSSNVTVNVFPANQPPVVNAGPSQSFMMFSLGTQSIHLSGTASDDGLPVGSTLADNWSEVSGPNSVSFVTPSSAATNVLISAPGSYLFQLSSSDTQFVTSQNVSVTAYGLINVNFGPTLQAVANTPITVAPTVLVGGQTPTGAMPLHLQWVVDGQPSGAHVTFGSPNTSTTAATFDTPGSYQLGLTTADANIPTDSQGNCCVTVLVAPAGALPPTVSIATPLDGAQLTAPTAVTGSVSGGTWTLAYALQDDFKPMTFTTIATGTGAVSNGPLGTLDPTLLLNGTYALRLTSVNASGLFASASAMVSVARNMKVGVFSLSFNDLTVPVSGVPIQVVRSYDSRDKGQGDFGIGWRLSLANIRLQKSRSLGPNWQETQTTSGFLPQYCLSPTDNKVVTITFPDGRVFTFQAGSNPQCQLAGSITNVTVAFTELPGPANVAGATLTASDGGLALVDGNIPGAVSLDGFDGNPYNPTAFILTTADGTKFTIDQQLGLTAVTDSNGNTLTINTNGISSSAGKSVPFGRDEQGRITKITDPSGNTLLYNYDSSGNLGSYTDRAKNTTTYTYDASHNLSQAILPNGTNALTNAFDSSGRLTGTTDANGVTVTFSNNVPGQSQTITDRNGNPTTYLYDSDGNVTQVTDALGHTTTSTYDANDNKLSDTNALGKTSTYTYDTNGNRLTETDPLSHTTTYTYNALNKPLTIQDPNGHTTTNTYDANGNLLTTTDPLGKTTTNTYSPSGLLASTKDPLGNTTSFTYDGSGNLLTQTDANGTVTTYAYDGNGNRTSQSVTRTLPGGSHQTLLTTYAYDGNGRLIKTTYPDNSTAQTIYNSIGQQATTIDALNRQTSYLYDSDGHLTQTTYPDASTDSSTYDHNGNRTRFIDRRNVLTSYVYDALNRVTQTKDSSTSTLSSTAYDAIGEVLSSTDADGNVTQYAYDAAGRRTTVTDALTHITTFGYDSAGNQTSVKDANNNITTYVYDNNNRRTQVTYPDGKFETTTYDALGRVTARTDANGKITQYNYDALGRLIGVVQDATSGGLNLLTSYAYDEVGDRITQTDAKNHATSYNYDQRGRRTQRTLPLGQSESYTYDAVGNLATRTDFNAKTTTYAYDAANRLLSKTPDPSFGVSAVTFTYTATGLRSTMTDASGTTNYVQYDNRARLTQVGKPAGSLQYTYDLAGNLTRLSAQTNVNYTYDALNRLSTVNESNTGTTTYGYDNVGNLQSLTSPNGVVHAYTYDTRNRLTNLGVSKTSTAIASYAYTLDFAGHRLSVSELSGRTVNYGYDSLYRLTSEGIASDPGGQNGTIGYTYDAVGNRTQMTSSVPAIPAGLWNYDANDRFTAGDTYDNDGNTASSGGIANVYDFENHLVQKGGVAIVYDGDGNRVSKTVAGLTTKYLVDDRNPTGYAQVVYETFSGSSSGNRELNHVYVYGLELISQTRNYVASFNSNTQFIYYVYDGHGSVRKLTDPTGAVTDTYDYDAFGNLIHSTGTTPNNYLYSGEQFDPDLNLYYNRARYLNTGTGRFWSMDTQDGDDESPLSLHRYLYLTGDPVGERDPSGHEGIIDALNGFVIQVTLFTASHPILTSVAVAVGIALAPEDIQNALLTTPGLSFEAAVANEARELSDVRQAYEAAKGRGLLNAGTDFGKWMANLLPDALKEIPVLDGFATRNGAYLKGSAVVDALWRGAVFEFKTSAGAIKGNQAIQIAKFAEKQAMQTVTYIFLKQPSPEEVKALATLVEQGSKAVRLSIGFLIP